MELLERLENRVLELVEELNSLRGQKLELQNEKASLENEVQALKASLAEELRLKEEVNSRINTVLSTIHDCIGDEA